MPRAIWTGTISFGLVNVPVRMYSAIEEHKLHFHYLHTKDDSPIGYEKYCKKEDKPVPDDEIGKAFEVSKGKYVYLDDEDRGYNRWFPYVVGFWGLGGSGGPVGGTRGGVIHTTFAEETETAWSRKEAHRTGKAEEAKENVTRQVDANSEHSGRGQCVRRQGIGRLGSPHIGSSWDRTAYESLTPRRPWLENSLRSSR